MLSIRSGAFSLNVLYLLSDPLELHFQVDDPMGQLDDPLSGRLDVWGADVTLIEAAASPLPEILDPELGEVVVRHLEANEVRVLTGSPVSHIVPDNEGVTVKAGSVDVRASASSDDAEDAHRGVTPVAPGAPTRR